MKQLSFMILFLLIGMNVIAKDIFVSSASSPSGGDGTKSNPYPQFYEALEVAEENDVIYVASGKYIPRIDHVNGTRYSTFTIGKSVTVKGGYSADFETNDFTTYKTILSGDLDGNDYYSEPFGLASSNDNNAYHVFIVEEQATLTMEGITVQGGNADLNDVADKPKSQNGGAIFSLGKLKLENVIITGNANAGKPGGGIYANDGIEANNVSFLGNVTQNDGGGLYVKNGEVILTNCTFVGNEADSGGGALMIGGTTGIYIANSTFYWNQTSRYGTCALYSSGNETTAVLVNNTFVNNDITNATNKNNGGGGAVYVNWGGKVYLVNNTIMGNKTLDGTDVGEGGAIYSRSGNLFLANNVIAGNYAPEGEDIYHNGEEQIITSLGYNLYTFGGIAGTIKDIEKDMIAGTSKAAGLAILAQIFQGNATTYLFDAETAYNGGLTETVKIKDASITIAQGKTIACLPQEQLSEATLNVDLNHDGNKDGSLTLDQRGMKRSIPACMGAYEYEDPTGVTPIGDDNNVSILIKDGYLFLNSAEVQTLEIYDLTGRKYLHLSDPDSERMIDVSSLPKGIYLVMITIADKKESLKVSL